MKEIAQRPQVKAHMEIQNMSFGYSANKLLFEDFNLMIPRGKITTLIGPNGCGKSTLLGILSREHKVKKGEVRLDGCPINTIRHKEFARKAAILHQYNNKELQMTVKELVEYGRTPYKGFREPIDDKAEEIINWSLKNTGILELQDKSMLQLSGGQRQRAFLAMSLCQQPEILFLDEPTTYLDIYYQLELLSMIKRLNKEYGMTIVMVLHDLTQALNYSDYIIMLKSGKVIREGMPHQIADCKLFKQVYKVHGEIYENRQGKYIVDFYNE